MRSIVIHKNMTESSYLFHALLLSAVCLVPGSVDASDRHDEPIIESTGVEITWSDDGVITTRVRAAKLLQYKNGDKVFPEGIYAEFYDTDKNSIAVILSARQAYYYADKNICELKGGVEIKNCKENQQIVTEALYLNFNQEGSLYRQARQIAAATVLPTESSDYELSKATPV